MKRVEQHLGGVNLSEVEQLTGERFLFYQLGDHSQDSELRTMAKKVLNNKPINPEELYRLFSLEQVGQVWVICRPQIGRKAINSILVQYNTAQSSVSWLYTRIPRQLFSLN